MMPLNGVIIFHLFLYQTALYKLIHVLFHEMKMLRFITRIMYIHMIIWRNYIIL